jgi:hypothetical protein
VQRPTLSEGQDGDMLGQPGMFQIKEPGVLNTQTLTAGVFAHRRLPAQFMPLAGRRVRHVP